MNRRKLLQAAGVGLVTTAIAKPAIAQAQGPIKIGLIQSMTGPFNDTGKADQTCPGRSGGLGPMILSLFHGDRE